METSRFFMESPRRTRMVRGGVTRSFFVFLVDFASLNRFAQCSVFIGAPFLRVFISLSKFDWLKFFSKSRDGNVPSVPTFPVPAFLLALG
jgi:hypothetical protein